LQELGRTFADVHVDQTEIAADPVLLVHDRVADANLRTGRATSCVDVGASPRVAPAAARHAGIGSAS
jgi:hypothetical protein